jgi:hypothetical protein
MAARNAFINALADTLRAAAPTQLTFSGTEGFFAAGGQQRIASFCWAEMYVQKPVQACFRIANRLACKSCSIRNTGRRSVSSACV